MFFPFFRDFSSSPHPDTVNLVVSFISIDTIGSKGVFSEVINVSKVTVLQVTSKITNNSFSFVFNVADFPETPSIMIKLSPELIKSLFFIGRVTEFSLPVVNVEW